MGIAGKAGSLPLFIIGKKLDKQRARRRHFFPAAKAGPSHSLPSAGSPARFQFPLAQQGQQAEDVPAVAVKEIALALTAAVARPADADVVKRAQPEAMHR